MTNEEIESYENEIEDLHNRLNIAEYDKERLREEVTNLETKIRALEPTTKNNLGVDCISRKAVNTLVDELARAISDERSCMTTRGRSTSTIMQDILDLPSISEKPNNSKEGQWRKVTMGHQQWYECDKCRGTHWGVMKANLEEKFYKYCPDCGDYKGETE